MRNTGYEKLVILGQGSYGKVYKVRNKSTGEECVMKIINTKKIDQAMFQNKVTDMEKINTLSSPYLVKYITSYIREEKLQYAIIMEYCSGGSLEEIIEKYKKKRENIPEDTVLKFMKQILLGLMALHKNKILHKNLKPETILVDSEGNLKLSDIGTSKQLSGSTSYSGTAKETLWYSSPEVLNGRRCNSSADIWSLGCILHELCCLEPPCTEANTYTFVMWWNSNRYDVDVIPKYYSKEIKNLIVSMLNYDRKLRPTCEVLLSNKLFAGINIEESKVRQLKNGDKYEGELKDDKPHGKGIYYLANGNRYEGEFEEGKKHGKGRMYRVGGDIVEGEWNNDIIDDRGIYYFVNGAKYEGELKDDMANGEGILYYTNGNRYKGKFKDNIKSGEGIYYFANKDRYEGTFKGNMKSGRGVFYSANGDRYEGEFKDNMKSGRGTYYFANGDRYEGEFKDNMKSGKGVYYFANGDKYDGEFKDNMKSGKGVYYFANGDKYDGEFKDNGMNGKGIFTRSMKKNKSKNENKAK